MDEERILEELILDDMQEWVEQHMLEGQDMYDYLDDIEKDLGSDARKEELSSLVEIYYKNHILPI